MSITTLHNPDLVNKLYQEYLSKIKFYQNAFTSSISIKYYNININASTIKDELNSTFDFYNLSDIKFDLYDLTPCYSIQPINNRSSNISELEGTMFEGNSNVVIYTIKRPRLNDLITFYNPVNQFEIFRVFNITTPINVLHSPKNELTLFELDLEYAPLKNLDNIQIIKNYVYDNSSEKYLERSEYFEYIKFLEGLSKYLEKINKYYSLYRDLYIVENLIPIEINELIYYIKSNFQEKYKRIFETTKIPYGYFDYFPLKYKKLKDYPFYENQDDKILNYGGFCYNIDTNTIEKIDWKRNDKIRDIYSESNKTFLEIIKRYLRV